MIEHAVRERLCAEGTNKHSAGKRCARGELDDVLLSVEKSNKIQTQGCTAPGHECEFANHDENRTILTLEGRPLGIEEQFPPAQSPKHDTNGRMEAEDEGNGHE